MNRFRSGIEEESHGDSEEADGAYGARGGHAVPRRAAHAHDRDLRAEQLPARGRLRVVRHRARRAHGDGDQRQARYRTLRYISVSYCTCVFVYL